MKTTSKMRVVPAATLIQNPWSKKCSVGSGNDSLSYALRAFPQWRMARSAWLL